MALGEFSCGLVGQKGLFVVTELEKTLPVSIFKDDH